MANEQVVKAINEKTVSLIQAQAEVTRLQKEIAQLNLEKDVGLWALVSNETTGFFVGGDFDGTVGESTPTSFSDDNNMFIRQETAQGFADVINLIVTVRQCEGAGQVDKDGFSFGFTTEEANNPNLSARETALIPRFPTLALLRAAISSVGGRERIDKVLKFLNYGTFE